MTENIQEPEVSDVTRRKSGVLSFLLFGTLVLSLVSLSFIISGSLQGYLPELIGSGLVYALIGYAISSVFTKKSRKVWRSPVALCITIALIWLANSVQLIGAFEAQSMRTEMATMSGFQELAQKGDKSGNRLVKLMARIAELGLIERKKIERIITDIHPTDFNPNFNLERASTEDAEKYVSSLSDASTNATIARDQLKVIFDRIEIQLKKLVKDQLLSEKIQRIFLTSYRLDATNILTAYDEVLTLLSERYSLMAEAFRFRIRNKGSYSVNSDGKLVFSNNLKLKEFNKIAVQLKQNGTSLKLANEDLEDLTEDARERSSKLFSGDPQGNPFDGTKPNLSE